MYRIDNADATSTLPTPLAPGPVPRGFFQSGNVSIGQKATTVDRDWANATQEEICAVIEAAAITLSKANHTQLLQALRSMFVTRTKVTGNMTIYVNPTTGSDANAGLTPTTAFATIQAAIYSVYYSYDWNGNIATIQLADGTYNFSITNGYAANFSGLPFGTSPGGLRLIGNTAFPANVTIFASNANCLGLWQTWLIMRGITFSATGALLTSTAQQGCGVNLNVGSFLDMQSCQFGNCGNAHMSASNGSEIAITGAGMILTGTTPISLYAATGGVISCSASSINVTGLALAGSGSSAFAVCDANATMDFIGASFAGSATGQRYVATNNATIITGGGGPNFLPGSVAGVTTTGGQYN